MKIIKVKSCRLCPLRYSACPIDDFSEIDNARCCDIHPDCPLEDYIESDYHNAKMAIPLSDYQKMLLGDRDK